MPRASHAFVALIFVGAPACSFYPWGTGARVIPDDGGAAGEAGGADAGSASDADPSDGDADPSDGDAEREGAAEDGGPWVGVPGEPPCGQAALR